MVSLTPGQMRNRLAAELDRSGYDYDAPIISAIVETITSDGAVQPARLAQVVTSTYLTRNGTSRQEIAALIARALGASQPKPEPAPVSISIREGDTNYNLQLSDHAQVGSLNVGPGTQIVVDAGADRDTVLAAVVALVQAGLRDEWDAATAGALASRVDERDDISMTDIQTATVETMTAEQPK